MIAPLRLLVHVLLLVSIALFLASSGVELSAAELRAGAAVVDVTPRQLPVIRNGGFLEATDDRVADPLHARCLCLSLDGPPVAIVVVDSCMIPLDVCEQAKDLANQLTGIARDRVMISATHAHSCPSVMDYCLGSRADAAYREYLPGRIAEAIQAAIARLEPAAISWSVVDASRFTHNRRWITRPDKMLTDPFGGQTVRAMMHPGHEHPEYVGPSGPVDPWLSVLSVRSNNGRPLAMLANFSMHYFGGQPGVSADYCGRFCAAVTEHFRDRNQDFVAIMSQGTSGDLWRADYGRPAESTTIEEFAGALADMAIQSAKDADYAMPDKLDIVERRLNIARRVPSPERLAWARRQLELMGDSRPRNQPEVYAEQAVYIDQARSDQVVLQAIQVGDAVITGIPNEVFALTGLKLKTQSPLKRVMNIGLANGASGYIPPPEQHALGGYTTWPARTAGLAVDAEPTIVEQLLSMIEELSGESRRTYREPAGRYAEAVLADQPWALWSCGQQQLGPLDDRSSHQRGAELRGLAALHLPGADGAGFGAPHSSRSVHLAGGHLARSSEGLGRDYTISGWFWNGMVHDARAITGVLFSHGSDVLALSGSDSDRPGCLMFGGRVSSTPWARHTWYHVALARKGDRVIVYLNGAEQEELSGELPWQASEAREVLIGTGGESGASWEGRVDEVAVFDRTLEPEVIARHYQAGTQPVADAGAAESPATAALAPGSSVAPTPSTSASSRETFGVKPATLPLAPADALRAIHVPEGFRVELVACEPMVIDPVAIDWGIDGRLWVAEMADYPSGKDGEGKPGGRIRWLADSDGDGTYDQSTVFLENVPFPNGVLAWGDGVLVTAAPEIFWARDTNGDGRADVRTPLYTGFLEGNQQLRVNGLRWGLDNWVHCASGGHHAGYGADNAIVSLITGERLVLGSRDVRIRPDSGAMEPESGPSQFGRARDDIGNWFGVQNSMPLWHYVLEDRYLARNLQVASPDPRRQLRIPIPPRVYPAGTPEKRYHGFDHIGRYTSACGIEVYRDEILFARRSATEHAFTCEPFHNLVQHHVLLEDGVTFQADRADDDGPLDFFAADDRWCRPVMARTGPDGALYVVDMYRYMIEHPEWLPPEGRDELKPFYRAGDDLGRIYRIVPVDRPLRSVPDMRSTDAAQQVAMLDHPNGIVRDWAQRLLVRSSDRSVVAKLRGTTCFGSTVWGRLQAMSILSEWGELDFPTWFDAVWDNDPPAQRWAVRVAEAWSDPARTEHRAEVLHELGRMAEHHDRRVRLQLACTLGEFDDPQAAAALWRLAQRVDTGSAGSEFEQAAILSSLTRHWRALIDPSADRASGRLLLTDAPTWLIEGAFAMASADPAARAKVLSAALDRVDADFSAANLEMLARGFQLWQSHDNRRGDVDRGPDANEAAPESLAVDQSNQRRMDELLARARRVAVDGEADPETRAAAVGTLRLRESTWASARETVAMLLDAVQPTAVQLAAVRTLVRDHDARGADQALARWARLSPEVRRELVQQCLRRPETTRRLVAHCTAHPTMAGELALADRQRLLRSSDRVVAERARQVFVEAIADDRGPTIDRYAQRLAADDRPRGPDRLAAGRKVFEQHCAACHRAGVAGAVGSDEIAPAGPDLRTLTDRSARGLLSAVLDPNRAVEPRYVAYSIVLEDGEVLQGMIAAETATALELRLPDGNRRTVLRGMIDEITSTGRSLMPDGMETLISADQMVDLIEFLQSDQL